MPPVGSKDRFKHLLSTWYSNAVNEVYGDRAFPAEFYDLFSRYEPRDLREMGEDISANKVGRPRHSATGSKFAPLLSEVKLRVNRGMSLQRACEIVAAKANPPVNASSLRNYVAKQGTLTVG